jgi:hypothetical protein
MFHPKRFGAFMGFLLALLLSAPAFGQSTATPVLPGLLTNTGCNPGSTYCWQPYSNTNPLPVTGSITPGKRTIVPLDIATVTTGGTPVAALNAGHRTAGGFLQNPFGATIALCINEQGTASGTTSAGATTCIQPGQSYILAPAAGAVSVITSDSSHPFSGYGLN